MVPVSAPLGFTANDCLDFGIDLGSPVGLEYYDQAPFKFNGRDRAGARGIHQVSERLHLNDKERSKP